MFCSMSRMAERKHNLDWIRKVLVEDHLHDECAPEVPSLIATAPTIVPFMCRPSSQGGDVEGEGVLSCPSWQLMRLSTTQKI